MCNIKINIVFRAEKITNLNLIHVSVFSSMENSNKRGIDIMRQNTNIIKANLSSDCVVSNAYLLFLPILIVYLLLMNILQIIMQLRKLAKPKIRLVKFLKKVRR